MTIRRIALFFIWLYQALLSPLLGPRCRHLPTCSEYAAVCIDRFGLLRGISLGLKRIGRCHPWGTSGYDPPPTGQGASDRAMEKS